jgi:hypothetical protein
MKYVSPRSFADPAVAARKLLEIANSTEAMQDGRIRARRPRLGATERQDRWPGGEVGGQPAPTGQIW